MRSLTTARLPGRRKHRDWAGIDCMNRLSVDLMAPPETASAGPCIVPARVMRALVSVASTPTNKREALVSIASSLTNKREAPVAGAGWATGTGAPRGVLRLRMQGCGVFERGAYGQLGAARSREFRRRLKRSATRGKSRQRLDREPSVSTQPPPPAPV